MQRLCEANVCCACLGGCDCVSISPGRWVWFLVARRPQCPHSCPPACLTMVHLPHCNTFLRVPGNPAWERREGSANVCSFVHTCSSSAIAQQRTPESWPEMRNSVKKPGAPRIYSQLRRGCSTSIKSTCRSREELARRSSLNLRGTQEQVAPFRPPNQFPGRAHATPTKT